MPNAITATRRSFLAGSRAMSIDIPIVIWLPALAAGRKRLRRSALASAIASPRWPGTRLCTSDRRARLPRAGYHRSGRPSRAPVDSDKLGQAAAPVRPRRPNQHDRKSVAEIGRAEQKPPSCAKSSGSRRNRRLSLRIRGRKSPNPRGKCRHRLRNGSKMRLAGGARGTGFQHSPFSGAQNSKNL